LNSLTYNTAKIIKVLIGSVMAQVCELYEYTVVNKVKRSPKEFKKEVAAELKLPKHKHAKDNIL